MRIIFSALVATIILVAGTTALADSFPTFTYDGSPGTQALGSYVVSWIWSPTDWCKEGGVSCLNLTLDWSPQDGSLGGFALGGYNPADPIVSEVARNFSSAVWSDWHVTVHNGIIRQDGSAGIGKAGGTSGWTLQFGTVADGTSINGFTTDSTQFVRRGDRISIYFIYDPIDTGSPVVIEEAPTSDFVPEPAGISCIMAGLGALGIGLRRRSAR